MEYVYTITLYWKNSDWKENDIGQPYFYLTVKANRHMQDHYKISTSLPFEAESYDAVMKAAGHSLKKYCRYESFERVQGNIQHYVTPIVRALLNDIAQNKGPVSLDTIAIPDFFSDAAGGSEKP